MALVDTINLIAVSWFRFLKRLFFGWQIRIVNNVYQTLIAPKFQNGKYHKLSYQSTFIWIKVLLVCLGIFFLTRKMLMHTPICELIIKSRQHKNDEETIPRLSTSRRNKEKLSKNESRRVNIRTYIQKQEQIKSDFFFFFFVRFITYNVWSHIQFYRQKENENRYTTKKGQKFHPNFFNDIGTLITLELFTKKNYV